MEDKNKTRRSGILLALLAAALYAVSSPLSKLLLTYVPSTLMAGLLYIGAGIGMLPVALIRRVRGTAHGKAEAPSRPEARLTRRELPYTVAMILLDIAAPICLLMGLRSTTAANAALLNNFEIVATALIALLLFREKISSRLWAGILVVTLSCGLLSFCIDGPLNGDCTVFKINIIPLQPHQFTGAQAIEKLKTVCVDVVVFNYFVIKECVFAGEQ